MCFQRLLLAAPATPAISGQVYGTYRVVVRQALITISKLCESRHGQSGDVIPGDSDALQRELERHNSVPHKMGVTHHNVFFAMIDEGTLYYARFFMFCAI